MTSRTVVFTVATSHLCVQDFVDRKLVVKVHCGECTAGGGGGLGCLREMSVTALRTTVTITDTGKLVKHTDLRYYNLLQA